MATPHPLDPLSAEEIRTVTAVLAREREVARPAWRFAAIELVGAGEGDGAGAPARTGADPYPHPVAGLELVVDMNRMELLEIAETGDPGRPEVMREYAPAVPTADAPGAGSPDGA